MLFERPTATIAEQLAVHGSWWTARCKISEALKLADVPEARLARWETCGSLAFLERHSTRRTIRLRCTRCKDRFCRTCATVKRRQQVARLLDLTQDVKRVRMITLTLTHSTDPLSIQIDRLYEAFRRLRQRDAWKTYVSAAAAACEMHVERDGRWHVHLHVLAVGAHFPHALLKQEWIAVTGDSRIVHLKLLPAKAAVGYAAKYLAGGVDAETCQNVPKLVEAIKALRGRRMLIVCGDWVGKLADNIEKTPEEMAKIAAQRGLWVPLGSLTAIQARAALGDIQARRILSDFRQQKQPRRTKNGSG